MELEHAARVDDEEMLTRGVTNVDGKLIACVTSSCVTYGK